MIVSSEKTRIIALPFAGGSSYSFRELENHLPKNYQWTTLELPGRGSRTREKPYTTIEAITKDLFKQVIPLISDSPYIIYGHSMGTLTGYELTKEIIGKGYNPPLCLFFTGRGAPAVEKEKKISHYDRTSFWEEIKNLGGLPKEVLDNEELMLFFEPIIRADFQAVEEYEYHHPKAPLSLPIYIRVGDKEDIAIEKLNAWQEETIFPIDVQVLSGDHFFIYDHCKLIIEQIIKAHLSNVKML